MYLCHYFYNSDNIDTLLIELSQNLKIPSTTERRFWLDKYWLYIVKKARKNHAWR